ncbi:MAG: hypothetical protein WC445_02190 [Patescibacteria group bacterium]
MEDGTMLLDREKRKAEIGGRLQEYERENPEIWRVILRVFRVETTYSKYDFLEAMWSLFEGLRMVTELLGQLPLIPAESAERVWTELHEAPSDVLNSEDFDRFRCIIEFGFRTALNAVVRSPDIKKRTERIFAMILRMVQIELDRKPD